MRIGNYQFSPALAPSIVVLFLFPGLISLGVWQLDRADEKREIEANVYQATLKDPFALNGLDEAEFKKLPEQIYRPAIVIGSYDSDHQFLYDNRTHKGKPGYHVLSPFILEGNKTAVLVNRGWIPYEGRRDNIQDISIETTPNTIKGVIKLPIKGIVLKDMVRQVDSYPQTIQSIALDKMVEALGYNLMPIVIELDESVDKGFIREWQPYYGSIAKHNGYAVQWFAMGLVLLLLFIKLSTKKIENRK